jgi:hypothetical protein
MIQRRFQVFQIDEVDGQIKLAQILTRIQVFDFGDGVERQIEIVEVVQAIQIF